MSEVTNEYATALADLAADEGLDEEFLTETGALAELFRQNPAYARLLSDPQLTKKERTALVDSAFSGRIHPYLVNFMKLLTERGYAARTEDFFTEYERIYCARHGIVKARAVSAVPLTDDQRERLLRRLREKTGKEIRLTCEVNENLLGGVRLQVDNTLYEGSVRAALEEIRASLASLTL